MASFFGGCFAEITKGSVELSVAERIWLLIVEVVNVIAEAINCDAIALPNKWYRKTNKSDP